MAGIWNNIQCWSCTLVFLTYVYMCCGCSPPDGVYEPPSTEEKLFHTDIFAYGKVNAIHKGGYTYDSLYTVNFEVYCSFKGGPLPKFINITRAGKSYEPGLCISNNFTKGGIYYIFLNQDFTPSHNEDEEKTKAELDDIPLFCDIEQIDYPKGTNESTAMVVCPPSYEDYEECIPYTTPKPDSVVVKTIAPKGKDDEKMPADGVSETEAGQVSDNGDNSGDRAMVSLAVTALCFMLAVL